MSARVRGALGALAILLVAGVVIVFSWRASAVLHARNLPVHGDGCYDLPKLGYAIRLGRTLPPLAAAVRAAREAHELTALNFFLAGLLGRLLPLSMASAVWLNGILYAVFALSAYMLFLRLSGSAMSGVLLAVPLLCVSPHLNGIYYGLTDLNLNLTGFSLGGSILCWALLSDRLRRPWPCLVLGLLCALLAMGRVFAFGVVGPCLVPLVLAGFLQGTRAERRRTLRGVVTVAAVMLGACGWWLLPRLHRIAIEPLITYGTHGVYGHGTFASTARSWYTFLALFLVYNGVCPVMPLFFGWRLGTALGGGGDLRDLPRRLHWLHLWLGVAPLLVLTLLRSWFHPYGLVAVVGLYLFCMFPLRPGAEDASFPQPGRQRRMLLLCAVMTCAAFLFQMRKSHRGLYVDRRQARRAVDAILAHAAAAGRTRVRVEAATHGPMNFGNLTSLFVFGTRLPVRNPIVDAPGLPPDGKPEIDIRAKLRYGMLRRVCDPVRRQALVEKSCGEMLARADYFVIMGPLARMLSEDAAGRMLSERLAAVSELRPLTPPLRLNREYDIVVLARKVGGAAMCPRVAGVASDLEPMRPGRR